MQEVGDALIVPVAASNGAAALAGPAAAIDATLGGELARLAEDARFVGKVGTTLVVPTLGRVPARRVVLVGVGAVDRLAAETVRRAWGVAVLAAREAGASDVVSVPPPHGHELDAVAALTAAAEGAHLALYRF